MQGHCTLLMYDRLAAEGGEDLFAAWLPRLFGEDFATYTFDEYPGVEFMIRDTAHTMHDLLQIHDNYGYDMQSFLDIIQRTGLTVQKNKSCGHSSLIHTFSFHSPSPPPPLSLFRSL
jgi:hypothetical protein